MMPDPVVRRLISIKRLAMWCAVCVLIITTISAFIRLSNVGLSCVDWPQCYGQNIRQAQQGVEKKASESGATIGARIVHRIVAVAALVIIIAMLIECVSARQVLRREFAMTLALLLLALFLAILGRWSSGARIPAVVIGNLLGGFVMLSLCWRLWLQVAERLRATEGDVSAAASKGNVWLRTGAWMGVAVLLCQIALGGLVSGSYSGFSCTGILECAGVSTTADSLLVPVESSVLEALNPWREPIFISSSPANAVGATPHMAHRFGALAAFMVLLPLGLFALHSGKRRSGWILLSLLVVQTGLGFALVALSLPLSVALAHNLTATLMLMVVFSLI